MFKKLLFAAAILISCPVFVFSQDMSLLFGGDLPEAGGTVPTSTLITDGSSQSGSVNIYSRSGFDFDAADINFFSSDTSVAQITGGEAFNVESVFSFYGARFCSASLVADADGASGNLFVVNISSAGIGTLGTMTGPGGDFFDPLFDPSLITGPIADVGNPGSFLIARVDFDIVGEGTTEFSMALGALGAHAMPEIDLNPTFASATLEVGPVADLGDVNMDGAVGFLDVNPFIVVLASNTYLLQADCNQDGVVNFFDIAPFIAILAGS